MSEAKRLVLLVEDDPSVRNLVTMALETHGYRCVVAASAATAMAEASASNPDLVLLDLGLPDLDGVEVIRRLRTWSAAPIIVVSARVEGSDKVEALDAGADDYLTKPFGVDELLARVRAMLRRASMGPAGGEQASTFENGALRIDYAAGCAWLGDKELHLTPIEYKLLCLLARNAGKVLTHTYISRQVWGTSWDNDVANLRVFMATLRKKLGDDPSHPTYIQTHVGVGYRMQRVEG